MPLKVLTNPADIIKAGFDQEGRAFKVTAGGVNQSYVMTIVQAADIGANYVAGSAGQYKTIKQYPTASASGDAAKLYTLRYTDATAPTKVTGLIESDTTV